MILTHHKWEKSGRTFKTGEPNQFCYTSSMGEQQTWDGLQWLPFLWKSAINYLQYGHNNEEVEFAYDKQILKSAGQILVSSSKFFVQKEISPDVWENQPHGLPTKNIQQDYPKEGRCTGYLNFPDAQYDLKIGLEVGRSARAIFGFRFRAPVSGGVRFIWVNDGIEKLLADWEWIWVRFAAFKSKDDRKIGVRFKDIEWRWGYDEALFRNIQVETNPDDSKKLSIIFGPYDYIANEWLEVYPDTFGPSAIVADNDDCDEESDTTVELAGYDGDGDMLGYLGGATPYDIGWRFPGVIVVKDATIDNGTKVACFQKYATPGMPATIVYGSDEDDAADWSAGTRPSQRTETTANVAWTPTDNDETWQDTPEIKTIIQEIVNRGGWASGQDLAIIPKNNEGSAKAIQFQDHNRENDKAATLTIVYTAAGGLSIPNPLHRPLAGPLGGPT